MGLCGNLETSSSITSPVLTLQLVFEESIYLYDLFYRLVLCIYCEPYGIYQSNVASLSTCLYTYPSSVLHVGFTSQAAGKVNKDPQSFS
jgi:polyferredoxin